jgi:hypothetical protein
MSEKETNKNLKILQTIYKQDPEVMHQIKEELDTRQTETRSKACRVSSHLGYEQYGENPAKGWKELLAKEGKLKNN